MSPTIDTADAGFIVGAPGNPISIYGSNLGGDLAKVTINSLVAKTIGGSNQAITIIIPTGATSGTLTLDNGVTTSCTASTPFNAN